MMRVAMMVLMMSGAAAAACAVDPAGKGGFRGKRRRASFGRSGGNRKSGKQGGENKPRAQVKHEALPNIDPENLRYDGELA